MNRIFRTGATIAVLVSITSGVFAQTLHIRTSRPRFTIPAGMYDVQVGSNWLYYSGVSQPVTVNLTLEGLPNEASYRFTDTNGATISSIVISSNQTAPFYLWIFATNVPQGMYNLTVRGVAGSVEAQLKLLLQAGVIWNGNTNNPSWGEPTNWIGGFPNKDADVIIGDLGGAPTNNIVTARISEDTEVASIRFMQTNANSRFHTVSIDSEKTLAVTGTNGFWIIRDYINEFANLWSQTRPEIYFQGKKARLVVSNREATFGFLVDGALNKPGINLSGLDVFIADVNRMAIGDYSVYPNFWNFQDNGFGGIPRRWNCDFYLAKTNIIRAHYKDPDYTNDARLFAYTYLSSASSGATSPYGTNAFGIWNEIYADSVCFIGANQQGYVAFNPALRVATNVVDGVTNIITNTMYLKIRNVDGGRVSVFAVGDEGGATSNAMSNIKAWIYLGDGIVDILADLMYLARDRAALTSDPSFQATMAVGDGIVDVNKLILGFQDRNPSHTNRGYCQGTLYVTNKAVLKVNDFMILGYATATDPGAQPFNTWGRLYVGSTAMVNRVMVPIETAPGRPNLSGSGSIYITGGHLILSNKMTSQDRPLALLNFSGDGMLTLHLDGPGPYLYVTNITTSGSGGIINIASVTNLGTYPVTVDLISYIGQANPTLKLGRLPSGMIGTLINDSSRGVIQLTLNTNQPKVLIWKGSTNNYWDTITPNWVRADTGEQTRFTDGDFVVFDDSAVTTEVLVAENVVPGQSLELAGITFSNKTKSYTFGWSWGQIVGTTRLVKYGSGSVEWNAQSEAIAELVEGSFTGGGKLGSVKVQPGAVLAFSGQLGGLEVYGRVTIDMMGSVSGPLVIASGGAVTNLGNIDTGVQTVTVRSNSVLYNAGTIRVNTPWTVESTGLVINNGSILQRGSGTSVGMSVYGTLMGTGVITTDGVQPSYARVTLQPGSTLIIGNNPGEIATMTIGTRLDMLAGARVIFDVIPGQTNDLIDLQYIWDLGWVNFGANASLGATLVINNLGGQFTPGTQLKLFSRGNNPNTPDNNIPAQPGVTPAPGPGMYWDISDLVTNLVLRVAVGQPQLGMQIQGGNLVMSWPSQFKWWRLEAQTNALTVGLSTNWVTVGGSWLTNSVTIPMSTNNPATFFRLVYP